ncbi:hypothetical protein HER10_EVM0012525 [Colletotrichum scovillei]|uniref:uncharacterized protein n=1 Tax=Colletotrichum scovillei TaxID=1209932 RepID=UPI0015C3F7D4|nr:uncharacterized protein HER10_EVM0012525 [Colletotrichum scovillei]KAF4781483.1 hypothetical protein HER10_EVM0012525 [Colletotrichum scovillei]
MSFSFRHYLAAGIRGMRVATGTSYEDVFDQLFQALNVLRREAAQSGDIRPYSEEYFPDDIYDPPSPEYINLTGVPRHVSSTSGPAQPGHQFNIPIRLSEYPQPTAFVQPTVYPTDPNAPVPAVHNPPPEPVYNPHTEMPRRKGDEGDRLWPCEYDGCDASYTRRKTFLDAQAGPSGSAPQHEEDVNMED